MSENEKPKSIIEDFADIGKRVRAAELERRPVVTNDTDCLCCGEGWIAVRRGAGRIWKAITCPQCRNPAMTKNPLP